MSQILSPTKQAHPPWICSSSAPTWWSVVADLLGYEASATTTLPSPAAGVHDIEMCHCKVGGIHDRIKDVGVVQQGVGVHNLLVPLQWLENTKSSGITPLERVYSYSLSRSTGTR
jgi:hypothetical protein